MADVAETLERLLRKAAANNYSKKEIEAIKRGFRFAERHHRGQLRKSGEPFIIHPLETAINLVEWRMDADTVVAGLLHDVVEDTDVTNDRLRAEFGADIAKLVGYVTKLSGYSQERRREAVDVNRDNAYLRQIYSSLAEDKRAIVVKLADRLHNMQTLEHIKPEKRQKIAVETLDVYGELAGRFGMYEVKSRLQDLAFKFADNQAYTRIAQAAQPIYAKGEKVKRKIVSVVSTALRKADIKFAVKDRNKSIYSIYKKVSAGTSMDEIRDIVGVRFIVDKTPDCYVVLGIIHSNLQVVQSAFKDYIANPKPNLYQSIHTTVVIDGLFCEVQIRTTRMDELADYGLAAHWRYKDHDVGYTDQIAGRIKELVQKDGFAHAGGDVRREIISRDVIVFLKHQARSQSMPKNATILDLAYRADPKRFAKVSGARMGGSQVNLATRLVPNSEIELFYAAKETINPKWLSIATVDATIKAVREALDRRDAEREKTGMNAFTASATDHQKRLFSKRIAALGFKDATEFAEFVKSQRVVSQTVRRIYTDSDQDFARLRDNLGPKLKAWSMSMQYLHPVNESVVYSSLEIAKCCTKIPGDHVVGTVQDGKLYAHNAGCSHIQSTKTIEMVWNEKRLAEAPRMFRTNLTVKARWIEGVVSEVARILVNGASHLNTVTTYRNKPEQWVRIDLVFYVRNRFALDQLVNKIYDIPQVQSVERIN